MIDINNLGSFIDQLRNDKYAKSYRISDKKEFEAIYTFLKQNSFPSENFEKRIDNIIIINDEIKGYVAANWNASKNTLTYGDKINLIHELFHVASTSDNSETPGITKYEKSSDPLGKTKIGYGLDEGITDMFTQIVDPNAPSGYPFERICAETLKEIFGIHIFDSYFNNSYDEFIKSFPDNIKYNIISLMNYLDEYNKSVDKLLNKFENNSKDDILAAFYTDKAFQRNIAVIKEITETIIKMLFNICEIVNKDKSEIIDFLTEKSNDPKFPATIKELINYDIVIDNIKSEIKTI